MQLSRYIITDREIIHLVVCIHLLLWVCETYVGHYLNGTGLHCAPPTCVVHNMTNGAQCGSVLHNVALYQRSGAQRSFHKPMDHNDHLQQHDQGASNIIKANGLCYIFPLASL